MLRRPVLALTVSLLGVCAAPAAAETTSGPAPQPGVTRPAILVGNNWDGTTDVVDPETFERLDRIDVAPDKAQREAEIMFDPVKSGFFVAVRALIGEGHDQLNDDVFTSNDGSTLFVSRPSYADVVAIDLATKQLKWRAPVDGYRSDHMAISADGTRLLVSASTGNVVHELDTATGARVGGFPSGDSPHESIYSKDGSTIFHASIGRVYLPFDRPEVIATETRGGEYFQVVDAKTMQVRKRIVMSEKMAEAGYAGFSAAVRPMALSPDERFVYFQLSFFHGFVEYDLVEDKVTRVARLPVPAATAALAPEQYVLDSAHHGIALDPTGTTFCIAGTMSDYGAMVDRRTFAHTEVDVGAKPYWSTNSRDGKHCYISASGDDSVTVISYATKQVVHRFKVGYHPQRVRNGVVRVADYPQGAYGEPFRLGLFHERSPIGVRGGDERFGCRAEGAQRLRLVRCAVQLRTVARRGRPARTIGAGERFTTDDVRALRVPVRLSAAGRRTLKTAGRAGVPVRVVARGTDSTGRVSAARTKVVLKVGTR